MASVAKLLAAACCAAGGARAADVLDSGALLQVGAAQPADGGQIFQVKRMVEGEPGSKIEFHMNSCRKHDSYGEDECEVRFGSNLTYWSNAKLNKPIHRGDIVKMVMNWRLKVGNEAPSILKPFFTGAQFNMSARCGICWGKCDAYVTAKGGFKALMTTPSLLASDSGCTHVDQDMPKEVPFGQCSMTTPQYPGDRFGIDLDMDYGISLLNSSGGVRASQQVNLRLAPPAPRTETSAPRRWTSLLSTDTADAQEPLAGVGGLLAMLSRASTGMDAVAQGLQSTPTDSVGPVGLLRRAHHEVLAESLRQLAGTKPEMPLAARGIDAMNFRVSIAHLRGNDGGDPVTISAGESCTNRQCRIPLGRLANWSSAVHMNATLPEGSYAEVSISPHFSGMTGKLLKPMLRPLLSLFPLRVPTCGNHAQGFGFMGRNIVYQPFPCGKYTFDMDMPPIEIAFPDFNSIKLSDMGLPKIPLLPQTFADLPGFSMVIKVDVLAQDKTPIASVEMEYGTGA